MIRNGTIPWLAALAGLLLAASGEAAARDLFGQPSIGLTPPTVIRPTPMPSTPGFDANQCKLIAGACPTGRLVRSGTLCYCATGSGPTLQGLSRTRPQDRRGVPPTGSQP